MKRIIVASMMLFAAFTAKAQSVELIPKAGINVATQVLKGFDDKKAKVGFQGGLGVNIKTNSIFSVQPEINFVSKGTKFRENNVKRDVNLNYLEVPVLAKVSLGPIYVNAGPSIGLMVTKDGEALREYGSKVNKIDFGVQMGGGLAIPAGPGKMIVDARYYLGLNDIGKSIDLKNRGFMASLGYAIPLGQK